MRRVKKLFSSLRLISLINFELFMNFKNKSIGLGTLALSGKYSKLTSDYVESNLENINCDYLDFIDCRCWHTPSNQLPTTGIQKNENTNVKEAYC